MNPAGRVRAALAAVPPVLALLLAVGLLAASWDRPLANGDEAVYAEFARTFADDPSATRWDGVAVHQRPPLYVALLAVARAVGGAGELPLRAVSALAAAAAVLAAAALARRAAAWAGAVDEGRVAGAVAAALAATSGLAWRHGASIESELVLAALVAWSIERLAAAAPAARAGDAGRATRALCAGAALLAGAALTKQVVGLLPLAAVGAWWIARDRPRIPRRAWGLAGALAVAIWLPWHVAATVRHGGAVWHGLYGVNVWARAQAPVFAITSPSFYARVALARDGLALALASGAGLLGAAWLARRRELGALVVLVPALAGLAALSAAATRIEYYALVLWPLIAAAGGFVAATVLTGRPARWALLAPAAALVLGLASHRLPWPHANPTEQAIRELAPAARALALGLPGPRVVVIGLQPSSPRAYLGLPVTRLVADEAEAARWRAIDVLAVPGVIEVAPGGACASPRVWAGAPVIARGAPEVPPGPCLGPAVASAGGLSVYPVIEFRRR